MAIEGHEYILKYIVDNGALIDVQDCDGVSKIILIGTADLSVS